MVAISTSNLDDTGYWKSSKAGKGSADGVSKPTRHKQGGTHSSSLRLPMATTTEESRFILWIDAVGGYLVCPRTEVTIGQAVEKARVDIPILGDLARRHLKIIRNPEGYLLEPFGYVKINGQECVPTGDCWDDENPESAPVPGKEATKNILRNGDVIELTGGIKIKFSKPHPLSASARLDFQSPHRTQPWSDGVLLMAESCVFGPNMRNHVVCRHWSDDLVFFQQKGQLFCKSLNPISIDGTLVQGKQELRRNSRIEGEDFSMTIEPLSS